MDGYSEQGSGAQGEGPVSVVGEAGTDTVNAGSFPSLAGEAASLVGVRADGHEGFDRVMLEFSGRNVPSYRVSFVEPPILRDGSGEVVDVSGEAFLELRLTPASGWDLNGGPRTYVGPSRVEPESGDVVTEVVGTGDFELTLAWTVGLKHPAPFAVAVLHDPLRLVVDVLHEPVAR